MMRAFHPSSRRPGNDPTPHRRRSPRRGKVVHKCVQCAARVAAQRSGVAAVASERFRMRGHPARTTCPARADPGRGDQVGLPIIAAAASPTGRGVAARSLSPPMRSTWVPAHGHRRGAGPRQRPSAASSTPTSAEPDLLYRKFRNTARVARNEISQQIKAIEAHPTRRSRISPTWRPVRGAAKPPTRTEIRRRGMDGRPGAGADPRHPRRAPNSSAASSTRRAIDQGAARAAALNG